MSADKKSFHVPVELKDADKGIVEALFATIGVVDHDEDIIRPGAIPEGADMLMSKYGHSIVTKDDLPVGDGAAVIVGNKAIFRGQLWLEMQDAKDALAVLKRRGPKQEWSFGFMVLGSEVPTDAEKKMGARRAITKLDPFEVSPVFRGAGIGTRTLAVKQADGDPGTDAATTTVAEPVVEAKTDDIPVVADVIAETATVDDAEAKRIEAEARLKAERIAADAAAELARLRRNMQRYT